MKLTRIRTFTQFIYERVKTESSRLHDLARYFEKDIDEKISELPEFYSKYHDVFSDWIMEKWADMPEEDVPHDWRHLMSLDSDVFAEYCDYLYELSSDPGLIRKYGIERVPLFLTYTYEEDVHDSWLVHFTDSTDTVKKILRSGMLGVQNMEDLANTGQNEDEMVPGGYCFAYEVSDAYYNFRDGRVKYGECGVLIRANGIKLYHSGDDELQTIFIGNEAQDLVGFKYEDGEFRTMDGKLRDKDFIAFCEKACA